MEHANVNVRIGGVLREYLLSVTGKNGTYDTASEYIRSLIRKDRARALREQEAIEWLLETMGPALEADASEYVEETLEDTMLRYRQHRQNALKPPHE